MMNKKPKPPITCSECKKEFCAPCGQFATAIDYKTRTGICKGCAKLQGESMGINPALAKRIEKGKQPAIVKSDAEKLMARANAHSLLGAGKMNIVLNCLKQVEGISGATAELGVYKGGSALLIASTAPDSTCYLFDTFEGIPFQGENDVHKIGDFNDASLDAVQSLLKDCVNAQYRVGLFPETATGLENETYKFVHIDGDQYQTTKDALEYFYPRMIDGGIMLFDDFGWQNCPGVAKALREFMAGRLEELEHPTQHQALIVKGKVADKSAVNVHTSGLGIGDAICALYACCGAAKAGHKIRFHTDKAAWLKRASHPSVEIVESGVRVGHDVNPNYDGQLMERPDRKQWYCDNLARAMGVESFAPQAPDVESDINEKRISFKKYVLFSPFSAYTSREWPKDRWKELAKLFVNEGYAVVALHGKGEKAEAKLTEYFGDIIGAHWFWGMDVEWLADAMLGADAVIGNDSGMAHFAALLGVKTVAIHSHCLPEQLWSKTNVIPVVSQNYDCVGCNWKPKYGFKPECNQGCGALADVTPMQVFKASNLDHKAMPPSGIPRYTPERDIQAIFNTIEGHSKGNILEIGCNEGVTTLQLAERFRHKTIYGVDCVAPPSIRSEQRYEIPAREKIGHIAKAEKNVSILIQDSATLDFESMEDVGVIFIDGDHSYEGVKADTENALAYMRKRGSGLIIWHDAYQNPPAWCGVWDYLQELRSNDLDVIFLKGTWVAFLAIEGGVK